MSPVAFKENTVVVVFGASGDLAKKKTFPALFGLFREGYLSETTKIIGYARSKLTNDEFYDRIRGYLKAPTDEAAAKVDQFLKMCSYSYAPYDTPEGYELLNAEMEEFEKEKKVDEPRRLFYLALPPSVFTVVAGNLKKHCHPNPNGDEGKGIARIIIEKPFGHDLESSRLLSRDLAPLWKEEELYRIDHYLGKEMVKNLMVLRFGNQILNLSWSRDHIKSIQVSFKEPFGTEGRGGYFDSIGIIRDVMQNHLLQVLTILAMERPVSFDPELVRDEKVKVLKLIKKIDHDDVLLGQYTKSEDGSKPLYVDDDTVPADSKCVTFALLTINIENERWDGVPIIMRAGKLLNEGKVEIRIQYKDVASGIFNEITRNELVIRIQPNELIYMKVNSKLPGVSTDTILTELDLSYKTRYKDFYIPELYESLIRDALLGNHANFVRDDELDVSWKLFTPLLNYLEGENLPVPKPYAYGSRGPEGLVEYLEKHGYVFRKDGVYSWPITSPNRDASKM